MGGVMESEELGCDPFVEGTPVPLWGRDQVGV